MKKRLLVVLKINNKYYKFFSIFYLNNDSSFLIHDHLKNEETPLFVAKPFCLLKSFGKVLNRKTEGNSVENGDQVHLSIHPHRIYLKKREQNKIESHLLEETEPQPFNESGYRMHCLLTPAPLEYLEPYSKNIKKGEIVIFNWFSNYCPQISIYELSDSFDISQAEKLLPVHDDLKIIPSEKLHPAIALHLRKTNGNPSIWRPTYSIFGKILHKGSITKNELNNIIKDNGLLYDISSISDNAIITDHKVNFNGDGNPCLTVSYSNKI